MAQSPQLNDSQLNLLAKIAANTGETQPKHGDGQHNLLFKIAQNTYASAVNGANIDISDVNGLQSALDEKVDAVDPNYILVKPSENLAEKYSQIKNYTPANPSSLLNGLLAFYDLSGLADASGNGNTLTNNDGVTFAAGKIGNAAVLTAYPHRYLTVPANLISGQSALSVAFWMKTTDNNFVALGLNGPLSNDNGGIYILASHGDVNNSFGASLGLGWSPVGATTQTNDGVWHHCAMSFNSGTAKFYVDSVLENTVSNLQSPIPDTGATHMNIGTEANAYSFTNGEIDALGLWSRALTDAEVAELYNAGHGIEHPFFRSATNRGTMFVVPGTYSLSSELQIDAEYVDIVGLGAQFQSPAVIVTNNTLNVTANDVRVSGVSVGAQAFKIGSDKPLQVLENCVGGDDSFSVDEEASGIFAGCVGGDFSFGGGGAGTASGKFTNCMAGSFSFGAQTMASGSFLSCYAGEGSFGGYGGTVAGELISCRLIGAGASYETPSGSGIIRFCLDGDNNIVNADAP